MQAIYDTLNSSKAKKIIIVTDSCFSGQTDGQSADLTGRAAFGLKARSISLSKRGKILLFTTGTNSQEGLANLLKKFQRLDAADDFLKDFDEDKRQEDEKNEKERNEREELSVCSSSMVTYFVAGVGAIGFVLLSLIDNEPIGVQVLFLSTATVSGIISVIGLGKAWTNGCI